MIDDNEFIKKNYDEIFTFFQEFNANFLKFYHDFLYGDLSQSNPLIKILMLIFITVIFYVLITFSVINDEREQKEILLLNNIIKRVSFKINLFWLHILSM